MSITVARVSIILFLFLALAHLAPVFALTTPSFPSCVNPQGTIKAQYASGTHGIVGDSRTYTGSDVVYKLSDETLFQCFCPDNGQGIQTNWWKVPGITDSERKQYESQGWIFVPTGAAWGLDDAPYLAKNSAYVCRGGIGGGDILGASVSGLAGTGNSQFILQIVGVGLLSLAIAQTLKKISNS